MISPSRLRTWRRLREGAAGLLRWSPGLKESFPWEVKSEGQVGERTGHSRSMGGGNVAGRENSTRRDPV